MKPEKARAEIRWADWLLAATTVLLALLLVFQCADVYRVGVAPENVNAAGVRINDIYTREEVARRFAGIAWAFWLWVAAFAAAVVDRHVHPLVPRLRHASPETQLALLVLRRERTPAMEKEARFRRVCAWACGAVCLLCAACAALYLFNPNSFTSTDLETVMTAMVAHILPFLLLAFAALMALVQMRHASACRELAAAKEAPPRASAEVEQKPSSWKPYLWAALYLAALLLLVVGILNGGMYDVLVKAVNICTECVGLG